MKKAPAIILLVILSFAALFAVGYVNRTLAAIFDSFVTGVHFLPVTVIAVGSLEISLLIDCLRRVFREKFGIQTPLYLVLAYVPSIIGTAVMAVFVFHKDYIAVLMGEGALLLAAVFWLIFFKIRKGKKLSFKKGIVMILVLIGGIAVSAALMFMVLLITVGFFGPYVPAYTAAALIAFAAAFGIDIIRQILGKAFSIKAPLFWALTYVPQLLFAAALFIYAWNIDRQGYWLGSAGKYLYYYVFPISNSVFAASGALWIMISAIIGKRRKVTLNESEN